MTEYNWDIITAPFEEHEVEWKPQTKPSNGQVLAVPYMNKRVASRRLDKAFGPLNWQNEYREGPDGGVICIISIWDPEKNVWVAKEDGAENTKIEAVKGGLTDAFKRACAALGMDSLYFTEPQWVRCKAKGSRIVFTQTPKLVYSERVNILNNVESEEDAEEKSAKSEPAFNGKAYLMKQIKTAKLDVGQGDVKHFLNAYEGEVDWENKEFVDTFFEFLKTTATEENPM